MILSTLCTGEKIFPLAWEVTESLEMYDIPVVSLTSDGAKPNRRFYRMCQQQQQQEAVPFKTFNPFREGKDLFFFCDAPHLLKTARNCFSNSCAHSKSRNMQVIYLPPLSFPPPPHHTNHLDLSFSCAHNHASIFTCMPQFMSRCRKRDKPFLGSGLKVCTSGRPLHGVQMCHKLTKDHVWLTSFTRMRVYLAAQVIHVPSAYCSMLESFCVFNNRS